MAYIDTLVDEIVAAQVGKPAHDIGFVAGIFGVIDGSKLTQTQANALVEAINRFTVYLQSDLLSVVTHDNQYIATWAVRTETFYFENNWLCWATKMQNQFKTPTGVITVDNKYTELHEAINTQQDYLRGDFLVAVADRVAYEIEHEIRLLLLKHYYTADVRAVVHEKHDGIYIVWYTAQGKI